MNDAAYSTGQLSHSLFGSSYMVQAFDFTGNINASHEGIELLLADNLGHSRQTSIGIRNQEHRLTPGKVLIYNAKETHSEIIRDPRQIYRAVVFSPAMLDRLLGTEGAAHSCIFSETVLSNSLNFLAHEFFYWLRFDQLDIHTLQSMMDGFLTEVLTSCPNTSINAKALDHFTYSLAKSISQFIVLNYLNSELSIEMMANRFGVTPFHVIRAFRKTYGITPHKFLVHLRLAHAKNRLRITSESILHLAMESGFNDLSTFNKAFKRAHKISPKEYRLNISSG